MHLAQINIGRLLHPKGDARVAEFIDNLEMVNKAAARMPGFVWQLTDDSGNATDIPFGDAPNMIANLTVWESVEALQAFVFQTVHARFYKKRVNWFEKLGSPHFAMWWIEEGTKPSYADAARKLQQLAEQGPSAVADPDGVFGWEQTVAATEWRQARCA